MSPVDRLVDTRVKQEIVDCCRRSVQYGLNFNTQGNISVRVPDTGPIAITPTDMDYDRMTAGDIVVLDAEGRRVEGDRRPSSETDVHLVVYRRRPDVGAIVHIEPVYSNVFGVLGQPVEAVLINMVTYSRGPGSGPAQPFLHPGICHATSTIASAEDLTRQSVTDGDRVTSELLAITAVRYAYRIFTVYALWCTERADLP